MSMPYQRHRDPVPLSSGGEIAFVILAAVLLVLALAALAGLAVATAWFGGGWVWPHGSDTIGHVLAGLLTGHPGAGLPTADLARVPSRVAVYTCIAIAELIALAVLIAGAAALHRWVRPGDARRGMASRWQAQQVLGITRLRANARLIRPDLHTCTRTGRGTR